MSGRDSAARWAEELAKHYEVSFREEERKEEVLEVFRCLSALEERRRVRFPVPSWGDPRREGAA